MNVTDALPPQNTNSASPSRPLPLRKRDDLIAVPVRHQNESAVVVKDPVAMKYTRLREDEFFVLKQLDGQNSLEQICERYNAKYFPHSVKPPELNRLLFRFNENGLLVPTAIGQAKALRSRGVRRKREKARQLLLNPIFIRFPGVDPDRFLSATIGYVRWLYHPVSLATFLALMITALVAAIMRIDVFWAEMTDMRAWFRLESMLVLACVVGATKALHELGHAYTCKFHGGECHTIGPMLLLFSPALYCDTSDAWMLPSRWKRASIGAAGMGVELMLASIATFVWIATPSGLVHFAAMNVMLVCSVSTILFNANPLLRYDGYYILSDLCDIPNLAQRSQRLLSSTLTRWCLTGGPTTEPIDCPARLAMLLYAAAAWAYRWSLTFAVVFLLSRLLEPIGLGSVGKSLCWLVIGGALYGALKPVHHFVFRPMNRRSVQMSRLIFSGLAVVGILALMLYPLPARVSAVATITPKTSQSVFAAVAGFVEFTVKPGERVKEGDLVARLRNPAIELDFVSAQGKLTNQQALIATLRSAELSDPSVSERLPAALATLEDLQTQFEIHRLRREALEIRAERAGMILASEKKAASGNAEEMLSEWSDLPTDAKNRGCFVTSGTELCCIADEHAIEAELILPQAVATRVATDAKVKLALSAMPHQYLYGKVIDVSRRSMSSRESDIDTTEAKSAIVAGTTSQDVSYLVRVSIAKPEMAVLPGQQSDALVATAPTSIFSRLSMMLSGLLRMR